ncbi:porin [Massilia sp. DWR3-1-1]|uniref:porin n=1 Tax=Massilia sp. DWR3-1-1 TaxID=2804559 RepID=UPI003CEA949E
MKLTALVFALLGASVGSAAAQHAATVYGVLDAGVVSERGCASNCSVRVDSGMASASRVGVRGSEAIDGNLAVVYGLEAGVQLDSGHADQGGRLFGRQAYVGIQGAAGTLSVGRQQNLQYSAVTEVGDPFKGGTAGSATNLIGTAGRREDNSIHYTSGAVHGVSAAASYARDEPATPAAGKPLAMAGNRSWGLSVGVAAGALVLRAAHQNRSVAGVAPSTQMGNNSLDAKNSVLAANMRMGFGTAYAAYSVSRGAASSPLWNPDNPYSAAIASTPSTDSRDMLVGLAVPCGGATLLASFIRKNDRDAANQDARQVALGATYALSRRTDFYAAYSRINNRAGAAYTVGNASAPGGGSSAVNVGMRHAF